MEISFSKEKLSASGKRSETISTMRPSVHYKNISGRRRTSRMPVRSRRRKRSFIIPCAHPTECSLRRSRCSNTYCTDELVCARVRVQQHVRLRFPRGDPSFFISPYHWPNTECAFAFLFLSPELARKKVRGTYVSPFPAIVYTACWCIARVQSNAAFSPRWIAELRAIGSAECS